MVQMNLRNVHVSDAQNIYLILIIYFSMHSAEKYMTSNEPLHPENFSLIIFKSIFVNLIGFVFHRKIRIFLRLNANE